METTSEKLKSVPAPGLILAERVAILRRTAASLTREQADDMEREIERACERVDEGEAD